MPDLPEHLEQLVEAQAYLDRECGEDGTPSADKLRRILEAAQAVAAQGGLPCSFCGASDWPASSHYSHCTISELQQALSDDPNS